MTRFLRSLLTRASGGARLWFVLLAFVFVGSRAVYFALGVRPDTTPIGTYLQYIDPALLRQHLWQSLFYLREQPPGFNLYLGLILKASGQVESVFFVIHLLMGAALAFSLMALMMRLGVSNWLAFFIAAVFISSPTTVLFENWVFYEYPVMVALCVAAWALARYLSSVGTSRDAWLFFVCLAVVASVRGVYHLSWFVFLALCLLLIARDRWQKTLLAAAVPGLLVLGFYLKNFIVFGDVIPGQQAYKKMNYAGMVQEQAPSETIDRLIRERRITRILQLPVLETNTPRYAGLVPQPPPTGIPLLDVPEKPSGADNFNSLWRARVADLYFNDARIVAQECPGLLWKQVLVNLRTYLLPATDVFPFDDAKNANCLRPYLSWYERAASGELFVDPDSDESPVAWLNVLLFPACLGGGLLLVVRELVGRRCWTAESTARCATILFALFNIVYVTLVTIPFSVADHNRYREEVAPLYILLLGLLVDRFYKHLKRRRRGLGSQGAETARAWLAGNSS